MTDVLTRAALAKLSPQELIDCIVKQNTKHNEILQKLTDVQSDLKSMTERFMKMESELLVAKSANVKLHDMVSVLQRRVTTAERRSFAIEQYSRSECIEISGIPTSVQHNDLEDKTLQVFKKIDINVLPENIEACHRLSSKNANIIVKFSKRKDRANVLDNKRKLKDLDMSDIGLETNKVFLNWNLCPYYKSLRWKCKKLFEASKIDSFWIAGSKVMMKLEVRSEPIHISHDDDISNIFPDEDLDTIYNTMYPARQRRPHP